MSGLSCPPPCTGNCNQGRDCPARFPLDMNNIAAQALGTAPKLRAWSLEYLSYGVTYKWAGYAQNKAQADWIAREVLDMYPDFSPSRAQLVAALEV